MTDDSSCSFWVDLDHNKYPISIESVKSWNIEDGCLIVRTDQSTYIYPISRIKSATCYYAGGCGELPVT